MRTFLSSDILSWPLSPDAGDELMARVGKENYADSLARKHVREMDFTGKPLAGYVFVGAQGVAKDTDLGFWVERCHAFAETLPAKAKK